MIRRIIILASLLLFTGCQMKPTTEISAGIDECENCKMVISNVTHAALLIDADEHKHTYCNPVCLLESRNKAKRAGTPSLGGNIFMFDNNDKSPINANDTFIVHGHFQTTMGHGLLMFASKEAATAFAEVVEGNLLSWNDLRVIHEVPDVSIILSIDSSSEIGEYSANKGDVVFVNFNNATDAGMDIRLTGYDFSLSAEANSNSTGSFVANLPGEGFAFTDSNDKLFARLRIKGDHTTEEAIYR